MSLVIALPHFSPGNLVDESFALTEILNPRRSYRKDIQRFKFTVSTVGCMLDFEDFLVYIKLEKILSKTFPFPKKMKKADCFLAEHKRGIAVFFLRATKAGCTEDSKFCSCCADILNQMTSSAAWILWRVRSEWLQMKMKKQD